MLQRYIEVDLIMIPPESSGRLKPIVPNGSYRPHLIVSNDNSHEMLGVQFINGPEILHGGECGQVVMKCIYFDANNKQSAPNYDKLGVGYQVRIVEGSLILAVGRILKVWDA